MGKLTIDGIRVDIEDRALAHLQMVITTKLRRGEPFTFTWKDDASIGDGRSAVWVHPQSSIHFKYHGSRSPGMNSAWIEGLFHTANSPTGLYIIPEPPAHAEAHADAELS